MLAQPLAEFLGARILGDPDRDVTGVASLFTAGPSDLSFVQDARSFSDASLCRAGVLLAGEFAAGGVPGCTSTLLIVTVPRLAFARAASYITASNRPSSGIHHTAIIDSSAKLSVGVSISAHAVVGRNVRIGPGTRIGPGCVLGDDVTLGENCELIANVTIYPKTILANRVLVHAGSILGSDGFGFVRDEQTGAYHKFPQLGHLVIENDVEIGAGCTVDRGALDATIIEAGAKLDNMVHVAHNVRIGRNVVIAAQTGIAGSSVVEESVIVGGQVGIADHVRIESGAILGAQAGVPSKKVIRGKGVVFWGTPARPIGEYLTQLAILRKLAKKK
jgi:UDP-3-O-[3-hydroxymyristoyl] glucosamine N-acyltransferase